MASATVALNTPAPTHKPGVGSTGPRTSEGKARSSQNAFKHGLASGTVVLPGENRAEYEAFEAALLTEHSPANTTEELLVREMASSRWLADRALRFQNACLADPDNFDGPLFALFLRYGTTYTRTFHRALNDLLRMQKGRAAEKRNEQRIARSSRENFRTEQKQPAFVLSDNTRSFLSAAELERSTRPDLRNVVWVPSNASSSTPKASAGARLR